jgi:hypothetical protein
MSEPYEPQVRVNFFPSLPYDRFTAYCKASYPQNVPCFSFQHPVFSLSTSSICLRLLPRLPIAFTIPCIFPSVTCFRRLFLGLGYTRDWLPADSFVARAWAMVLNGRAHTVRHVRGKTKLSSSSADIPRQLCVRTVGRLEK